MCVCNFSGYDFEYYVKVVKLSILVLLFLILKEKLSVLHH